MINNALVEVVSRKVLEEEMGRVSDCECCTEAPATYLYFCKQGVCTTLSHVCHCCMLELVDVHEEYKDEYDVQWLSK